jgi:hypothetical protein
MGFAEEGSNNPSGLFTNKFLHISINKMMRHAQVGLAEAQQIKVARKPNSSSAHPTQWEAQSTQKTSPVGEGCLSLLKWLPPLKLSKVGLFWDTYRRTCGPRDLTVLHRRDVGLGIEPYTHGPRMSSSFSPP